MLVKISKHILKCGDCLDLMNEIPDKSIDMILCDLPYGVTHNEWDKMLPLDKLWEHYSRIIKDKGVIALFAQNAFMGQLITSNPKMFRYNLVWDKVRSTGFLNANKMPLRRHEDILIFYKSLPTYNPQMTMGDTLPHSRGNKRENEGSVQDRSKIYGAYKHKNYFQNDRYEKYPTSIISITRNVVNCNHPTEKPVEILEWLIKTYTNKWDTVLDNCMGVGSTGVACIHTERNFIGYEICREYFEKALNRIEEERRLFYGKS